MNLASALRSEITRLARKEQKADSISLRKAVAQHRGDIASLKRRIADLERLVKQLSKAAKTARSEASEPEGGRGRFSAKGLASHRQKLGLSAEQYGSLIGVSGQSIYKWEAEKSTPRAAQLAKLVSIRGLGKREALSRLAESV